MNSASSELSIKRLAAIARRYLTERKRAPVLPVDQPPDRYALNAEIAALCEQIPAATPDTVPNVVRNEWGELIWCLPMRGREAVFMKAQRTNFQNEKRFVVMVKARAFYAHWRLSALGSDSLMRSPNPRQNRPHEFGKIEGDYKYSYQERVWSWGMDNAVPLARAVFDGCNGIDFIDGMTRTMWLVRNGAAMFPVEAQGEVEAAALHALTGYDAIAPITIEQLVRTGSADPA